MAMGQGGMDCGKLGVDSSVTLGLKGIWSSEGGHGLKQD
jgi:hypothetical protein